MVEATAGNTGLGLALVARIKGYRVVLVVPDKMAIEKVLHLKALGAEIHLTRSDVGKGHPEYYQDLAARLASEIPGAWFADQFNNPANPLAHETTTGPEIWEQAEHELDAIVVGVGSSGTLTGLSRYFKQVQPAARIRAGRSERLDPGRLRQHRRCCRERRRLVGGGRHRRRLHSRHRRPVARQAGLHDHRRRKLQHGAPAAAARKASWPARRPARCWPRHCATAASRPRPSAWSPSCATPARAT